MTSAPACWRAYKVNNSVVSRFIADENFDNDVIHSLIRRKPDVDIIRVQDVGLLTADDPTILAFAAQEGRLLLTQDIKTVPSYAYTRVRNGQAMPGVVAVGHDIPIGEAIDDILLLAEGSREGEWEGQVVYLPL